MSGAGLSLDKLTEAEQLALLSGLPLGSEIFSRDATTIEASSPRTIDGYQALSEVRSVPDATVLDYVAGGLNAGANAINDLVDIVGGPERAEWLVGGIQAAIYGVPKTAVDLAVGKLIEPGVSFVAGKISGVLKTDVFSYQASPESAEVLSDTLGGMTAEMVFGKARGVVSNSQGYAVAKETVLATKQAARGALDGPLGVAANRFFRDAAKNAQDFRITDIAGGGKRFEFFSPAKNPGYGKRYIQEVDNTGAIVRELKDTLGPEGLIETKWIHGGP